MTTNDELAQAVVTLGVELKELYERVINHSRVQNETLHELIQFMHVRLTRLEDAVEALGADLPDLPDPPSYDEFLWSTEFSGDTAEEE